jgi:hypothetical protein
MVFSDGIAENMLDLPGIYIKTRWLAPMDFHNPTIQEAAYNPSAVGMARHRILDFGYPMPQEK